MRFRHRFVLLAILGAIAAGAVAPWAFQRYKARPSWQLANGSPEMRAWAVRELSKAGLSARTLALVESSLGDADASVRCAAMEAIARVRSGGALGRVVDLAERDPVLSVRLKALETLGEFGGAGPRATLRKGLSATEPEARAAAALGLGRCGAPEDVPAVKALLSDAVPSVRAASRAGLALLDWRPAPASAAGAARADGILFEAESGEILEGNFEFVPASNVTDREAGKEVAGEGRWVRDPEGAGGNHDWLGGSSSSIDIGRLRYQVPIPSPGRWVLWARACWMDKCGDSFRFRIGKDRWSRLPDSEDAHDKNRYRAWVWERSPPFEISEAGVLPFEIQAREDGIRIDRLAILPAGRRPEPDAKADFEPLALLPDGVRLSFSRTSEVLPAAGALEACVFVQRAGTAPLDGTVEIEAEDAEISPAPRVPIVLEGSERLAEVPFRLRLPPGAPSRERRLIARFVPRDPKATGDRREWILSKPWPWEIAGPYPKDLDEKEVPAEDWKALPERAHNAYKTIDLERIFGNGASGSVCLRARFEAGEDFEGLFLMNADDGASVFLDGAPLVRSQHRLPAEGFLARTRFPIRKGEHRVFAIVRNRDFEDGHPLFDTQNYWLFRLRLRRDDHVPAFVRGLPWR